MDIAAKIEQRRRQILVHSILYYRYDTNLVPDAVYDKWALELQKLQADHPEISKRVKYMRKEFETFTDSTTGFDLPLHDRAARGAAQRLIYLSDKYKENS